MGSHIFNRNLHEILGERIYSARCDSLPKKRFREIGEGRLEELALVPAPLVELLRCHAAADVWLVCREQRASCSVEAADLAKIVDFDVGPMPGLR